MKTKIKYEDIKLGAKVQLPIGYRHLGLGEITTIDNMALLDRISEPIFTLLVDGNKYWHFGIKYVTKNIVL